MRTHIEGSSIWSPSSAFSSAASVAEPFPSEVVSPPRARASNESRRDRRRAALRLAHFAAITGRSALGLAARRAMGTDSPAASARLGQAWAREVFDRLGFEPRVLGPVPPPGVLVVANHRSYVDIPAILAAVPAIFLAKVEVGRWPLLGFGARLNHTVFVRREDRTSRKQALVSMRRVLDGGTTVALFPEGTTTARGMASFHPGSFRMAAAAGVSVVPAALRYDDPDDAWIGDEDFVAHFLRRCGRRRMGLTLELGPVLGGADAEWLKSRAEDWILGRIGGTR